MARKKKQNTESVMPFGKYKGAALAAVLCEEPTYLCWFMEAVEGCAEVKKAISALPGFQEEWTKYYQRKYRKELTTRQIVEETVREMFSVEGSPSQPSTPEQFDDLCDRLFNAPPDAS